MEGPGSSQFPHSICGRPPSRVASTSESYRHQRIGRPSLQPTSAPGTEPPRTSSEPWIPFVSAMPVFAPSSVASASTGPSTPRLRAWILWFIQRSESARRPRSGEPGAVFFFWGGRESGSLEMKLLPRRCSTHLALECKPYIGLQKHTQWLLGKDS